MGLCTCEQLNRVINTFGGNHELRKVCDVKERSLNGTQGPLRTSMATAMAWLYTVWIRGVCVALVLLNLQWLPGHHHRNMVTQRSITVAQ